MKRFLFHRPNIRRQFLISIGLILIVSLVGLSLYSIIGYRVVAFMLLVSVSVLAMFLEIVPVLAAAALSVGTPEDSASYVFHCCYDQCSAYNQDQADGKRSEGKG